jgi:hypothetical protein
LAHSHLEIVLWDRSRLSQNCMDTVAYISQALKNQYYANKALLYHLRECALIYKIQVCDKMKHNPSNVREE